MEEKNGQLAVVKSPEKIANGRKSFWHVNREMLPYKIHFFLFIGGMGATLPYLSAIGILKLGLTASNIAAAYTAQQFLFLFVKPCIGLIADYFNRLKATVIGLTVLQAFFCFLMIIIPGTGMPGITGYLSPRTSHPELHECEFCNNVEDFRATVPQTSFDEINFELMLDCFNDTDRKYSILTCSKDYTNSVHSLNGSYKIVHRTCNSSDRISRSTSDGTSSNLFAYTALFISISSNASQNSVICFLPGEQTFQTDVKFPHNSTHSCQRVSDLQYTALQKLFLVTPYKTLNCTTSNAKFLTKNERHTLLSAANYNTYQFWLYTACVILSCSCISSIFTISDTACYESIQNANYGQQRAWGAISWGLIAPLAGFLNDYTDDYLAAWCLMVVMCSLQIWNLSRMNLVKPDFSQNILRDIKTIFSSVEFLAFEAGVFMNGVFTGGVWFYLTWFLTSIGGNKLIIGLAHTLQCYLGEVPFMFVSDWLIKKLGHFNLVSLALIGHGVRFFAYSYLYNPWWILPIESLHGITFGSFYSAMTSYGKLNAKPGTEATTQSVLCTTYEALGAGLGCLVFGVCFDYYGGHRTFFYASFVCGVTTVINLISTILVRCRKGELDVTKATSECVQRY